MTRSEAVKIVMRKAIGSADGMVDMFVALGMLKLDEPKSVDDRLRPIFRKFNIDCVSIGFLANIDAAGLKIVEK